MIKIKAKQKGNIGEGTGMVDVTIQTGGGGYSLGEAITLLESMEEFIMNEFNIDEKELKKLKKETHDIIM